LIFVFHPVQLSTQIGSRALIEPETLKLVQERTGYALQVIGIGNYFLNRAQMAQQLKERVDK
jgi:hypothetical protein